MNRAHHREHFPLYESIITSIIAGWSPHRAKGGKPALREMRNGENGDKESSGDTTVVGGNEEAKFKDGLKLTGNNVLNDFDSDIFSLSGSCIPVLLRVLCRLFSLSLFVVEFNHFLFISSDFRRLFPSFEDLQRHLVRFSSFS